MAITRENLTLHNIKRAIKAYYRIFKEKLVKKLPILEWYLSSNHIKEQVSLRLQLMNETKQGQECLSIGECLCGCPIPQMQYADDGCEGGCYGPMMGKEEWEKYKESNNLTITLVNPTKYAKSKRK